MADKRISELPIALAIDPADISVLVGSDTNYQFSFTTLLTYVAANLSVGSKISFGSTIPQDITGNNGDVFLKTDTAAFYQKTNGSWALTYTIATGSDPDGTLLYGNGAPGSSTGANNDSYIDTTTGIFYLKTSGSWAQVFSMATGPQGPQGIAGINGTNGTNGNTVLNGTTNPSNSLGNNGDFYINTSTYYLFGPKASNMWPAGTSIIGGAPDPVILTYAQGVANPIVVFWADYADTFGNSPTILVRVYNTTAISTLNTLVPGSGYVDGIYSPVQLTGGTGSGALANITVSGGAVISVVLTYAGIGYVANDILSANNTDLGGSGSGFSITVSTLGNNTSGTTIQADFINDGTNTFLQSFSINDPDPNNAKITADTLEIIIKQ
jgi:hypothetical protein